MTSQQLSTTHSKLTDPQKVLFKRFGLRQIKYFIELDLPLIIQSVPENLTIMGMNRIGRVEAINKSLQERYGFFKPCEWSKAVNYKSPAPFSSYVPISDFQAVYDHFNLGGYSLDDLTHTASNFLSSMQEPE